VLRLEIPTDIVLPIVVPLTELNELALGIVVKVIDPLPLMAAG
jgi:hypothetical protein